MKRFQSYFILLLVPLLVFAIGCSDDEVTGTTESINEAQVLVDYLEANGDYLNTSAPSIVSAADVRTTQLTAPTTQYLIDPLIRRFHCRPDRWGSQCDPWRSAHTCEKPDPEQL